MRVARTIRFCTSKFFRHAEIKILPYKQSENPLRLREIQEFYRLNKAEFYPLKRNLKFRSRQRILKFPQKNKAAYL